MHTKAKRFFSNKIHLNTKPYLNSIKKLLYYMLAYHYDFTVFYITTMTHLHIFLTNFIIESFLQHWCHILVACFMTADTAGFQVCNRYSDNDLWHMCDMFANTLHSCWQQKIHFILMMFNMTDIIMLLME